jgi:hypothetical protein
VRQRRAADLSPPSSSVGHERVELYLYSPLGHNRACKGVTLPLPLLYYNHNVNFKTVSWFLCYLYVWMQVEFHIFCDTNLGQEFYTLCQRDRVTFFQG